MREQDTSIEPVIIEHARQGNGAAMVAYALLQCASELGEIHFALEVKPPARKPRMAAATKAPRAARAPASGKPGRPKKAAAVTGRTGRAAVATTKRVGGRRQKEMA